MTYGFEGQLCVGVTSTLPGRLHQHRAGLIKGFPSRYGVTHNGFPPLRE
jgi:putative endonuclease